MRAKFVNENIRFERGKSPKTSMDIGRTPKRQLEEMENILGEFGIHADYGETPSTGPKNYEIHFSKFGPDPYMSSDDISQYMGYLYTEEGNELADEDEEMVPGWVMTYADRPGHFEGYETLEEFLKAVIEIHYGDKDNIKAKIKGLSEEADKFKKALSILEGNGLNENVNFERGTDPKRSMGIGVPNLDNPKYKWADFDAKTSRNPWSKRWSRRAYETTYKGKTFRMYDQYFWTVVFEDGSEGFIRINPGKYSKMESIQDFIVEPEIREFMEWT
jgi:hypothetical protein